MITLILSEAEKQFILTLAAKITGVVTYPNTASQRDLFTERAKTRLVQLNLSITQLARNIGYARNTVSQAINHPGYNPHVRAKVEKALGLGGLK